MQQKIWGYLYSKAKSTFDSFDKVMDEARKVISVVQKYIKSVKFKKDGVYIRFDTKGNDGLDNLLKDKAKYQSLIKEANSLTKKAISIVEKTMKEKDFINFLVENGIDEQTGIKEANAYIKDVIEPNMKWENEYAEQELRKLDEIIRLVEKAGAKQGGKKAYSRFDTKAESSEYAEFQAHKIVSAAFDKVFRR